MSTFGRCFLTLVSVLFSLAAAAQCNDWEQLIYYKHVTIDDVARDRFDNLYVAGSYHIDDFVLGPYTFPIPASGHGAFIAKYDKNFSLVWATNPVDTQGAFASEIEVDANDNIVVAGIFYSSITFDCITLTSTGRSDIFVVNYTPDGLPMWATSSSGADDENPAGLTISANGNIILAAIFVERSSVTPWLTDPDVAMGGVPVITGAVSQIDGGYDSFVAAIRPNGTVAWTKGVGGEGNLYDYIQDIKTDSHDNVIFTGYFASPQLSFDGHIVHSFTVSENFFFVKLTPDGHTLWARESEGGVDQGGYGVAVDSQDNIFVAGRFYGPGTKFGTIDIVNNGEADAFVTKVDPDGIPLSARSIGDTGFDSGTQVEVDSQDRVLVSAYYYSYLLDIGPYSSTKSEFQADSFIATLSNDLATVECARFVTGPGEDIVWNMELDFGDNAWLMVDNVLNTGASVFGSKIVDDPDVWSVVASVGNNPSPYVNDPQPPPATDISLGSDVTICHGEKVKLSPGQRCNAQYLWSTGSTNSAIEVTQAGTYWVDVTWQGNTVHDEIEIFNPAPIMFTLGNDQLICPGNSVAWNLPVFDDVTYLWSDGSTATTKTVSTTGTYWVKVSNTCQTVSDTAKVTVKLPPVVDLGNDLQLCAGKEASLSYTAGPGETIKWSDGSTATALAITAPGTYTITVSNGCTIATDEVGVTLSPLPVVDLGEDQKLCDGKEVHLSYAPKTGETVQWSDGSTSPTLTIEQAGTYGITVTNRCGAAQDEVLVTIKDPGEFLIPNVITPNGDNKNDYFQLPDNVQDGSLTVYNRWGERIFTTSSYENNWPQASLSTGVYFYTLRSKCIPDQKGMIQLIH